MLETKTLSQSENVNQYLQNRKNKEIKVKNSYIKSRGPNFYLCNFKNEKERNKTEGRNMLQRNTRKTEKQTPG